MVNAASPVLAALNGAGLQVEDDPQEKSGPVLVIRGNTYKHKDLLKAQSGRWSKSRSAWVFEDPTKLDRLAQALTGLTPTRVAPGFAEAPATFQPPSGFGQSESGKSGMSRRDKPHYHGHRKRLRARFMGGDGGALPDYELLEMLLFFSIRYVDVKPLAKGLLKTFGSLGGVLAADPKRLEDVMRTIDGAEGAQIEKDAYFTVTHLKAMQHLLQRVLAEDIKARPVISSWQALLDYLKLALGHEPIEQFRLLFLDKKNILIEDGSAMPPSTSPDDQTWNYAQAIDDVQQRGTVDHTPLYPREIAKRALELGASALIMVHNHPSGDPTPSRADIEMTKQVEAALAPIKVALHDHLIIGKNKHLSFKSEGLL